MAHNNFVYFAASIKSSREGEDYYKATSPQVGWMMLQ